MASLTVTAKRQATLPAALCDEMGVKPGDKINAERRVVNGETVWLLRSGKPDWSWFGSARKYGKRKSHGLKDIQRSIERGWAAGDRP